MSVNQNFFNLVIIGKRLDQGFVETVINKSNSKKILLAQFDYFDFKITFQLNGRESSFKSGFFWGIDIIVISGLPKKTNRVPTTPGSRFKLNQGIFFISGEESMVVVFDIVVSRVCGKGNSGYQVSGERTERKK